MPLKDKTVATGLRIYKYQMDYVKRKELNLSELIRRYLDDLMKEEDDKSDSGGYVYE